MRDKNCVGISKVPALLSTCLSKHLCYYSTWSFWTVLVQVEGNIHPSESRIKEATADYYSRIRSRTGSNTSSPYFPITTRAAISGSLLSCFTVVKDYSWSVCMNVENTNKVLLYLPCLLEKHIQHVHKLKLFMFWQWQSSSPVSFCCCL